MTERKSTRPNRLADRYVRIRPQGGAKVQYRVPELPAGKFTDCDGQLLLQMAMDLDSDDPDALVDPDA
jgi:hypothetical protein